MMDDPLLSIQQAMTKAGVSRRTIYHWLRSGKLRYLRTAGGSVRIVADSLFRAGDRQVGLRESKAS